LRVSIFVAFVWGRTQLTIVSLSGAMLPFGKAIMNASAGVQWKGPTCSLKDSQYASSPRENPTSGSSQALSFALLPSVFSGEVLTHPRISPVIHVALSFEFLPVIKVSFNFGFGIQDSGFRIWI
jgi:hypothetical protein